MTNELIIIGFALPIVLAVLGIIFRCVVHQHNIKSAYFKTFGKSENNLIDPTSKKK